MIATVWGLIYSAPMHAGYGAHWPLRKTEAMDLAEATAGCLKGSDSEWVQRIIDWLMNMMPVVTFVGLLVMFTAERVRKTREMFAEQERLRHEQSSYATDFGQSATATASDVEEASEGNSATIH